MRRLPLATVIAVAALGLITPPARAATLPSTCTSSSVLLLSAYPAEIRANLDRLVVDPGQPQTIQGVQFYAGTLLGRHVVMGLTGEGAVNARTTTALALQHFTCISAIVFSGTAGGNGPAGLGDVTVPDRWTIDGGATFTQVDPTALEGARKIEAEAVSQLETSAGVDDGPCGTELPPIVFLPTKPTMIIGGDGYTDDATTAQACGGGSGGISGCQPCPPSGSAMASRQLVAREPEAVADPAPGTNYLTTDLETAAAQQIATKAGIPFIAFRGISDTSVTGNAYAAEYVAYQTLAADNAAVAARLWVRDWRPTTASAPKATATRHRAVTKTTRPTVRTPTKALAATGTTPVIALAAVALIAVAAVLRRRR